MRKRNWRRRLVIGAALLFAAVAALFYFALREDRRYVRAANELPALKAKAQATFGALTWSEFRKKHGSNYRDDREAWRTIADSAPKSIDPFGFTGAAFPESYAAVLDKEREWFDALPERIMSLKCQHSDKETWAEQSEATSPPKKIAAALQVAIVGAADKGDATDVRKFTAASWRMANSLIEEPDLVNVATMRWVRTTILRGIVRAAVKDRHNDAVMRALEDAMLAAPLLPSFTDIVAGEARSYGPLLEQLRELPHKEVGKWLYDLSGLEMYEVLEKSPLDRVKQMIEGIKSGEELDPKITGPHTTRALEARFWEVALQLHESASNVSLMNGDGARDFVFKSLFIVAKSDPSYDFAKLFNVPPSSRNGNGSDSFAGAMRPLRLGNFSLRATELLLSMLRRYPSPSKLPASLPPDLAFSDPFGGGLIKYRRTATGFLVYTVGENGKDDGFLLPGPGALDFTYAAIMPSLDTEEWGLAVSYTPTEPRT